MTRIRDYLLLLLVSNTYAASVTVQSKAAIYEGVSSLGVDSFRGITYAEVGPERFVRATLMPENATLLNKATALGPLCHQAVDPLRQEYLGILNILPQADECLTLDIYRPTNSSPALDVMVWIHGGGFTQSSGTFYDGSMFAQEHDVIIVSINYRMGLFGFLSDEKGNGGGMNGIHDQILALQWIQNYIKDFGGSPSSVTVFGQSAGSISTCLLMASPLTKGLFHRAILQSGSCFSSITGPAENQDEYVEALLAATGANSVNDLKNISRYPADEIRGYANSLSAANTVLSLQPSIDGYVLEHMPSLKDIHIDSILLGSTSYDDYFTTAVSVTYALNHVVTIENQREWIKMLLKDFTTTPPTDDDMETLIDATLESYSPDLYYNNSALAAIRMFGDSLFTCDMRELASLLSSEKDVYLYIYNYNTKADLLWDSGLMEALNLTDDAGFAGHGSEGGVLWGSFQGLQSRAVPTEEDLRMSRELRARWVEFAKTGNPNIVGSYYEGWTPVPSSSDAAGKATSVESFVFGPGGNNSMESMDLKQSQCQHFIGTTTGGLSVSETQDEEMKDTSDAGRSAALGWLSTLMCVSIPFL